MKQHDAGAGWITFAGVMVTLAGLLNIIWGIIYALTSYGGRSVTPARRGPDSKE
jgi:hypothetical protein